MTTLERVRRYFFDTNYIPIVRKSMGFPRNFVKHIMWRIMFHTIWAGIISFPVYYILGLIHFSGAIIVYYWMRVFYLGLWTWRGMRNYYAAEKYVKKEGSS